MLKNRRTSIELMASTKKRLQGKAEPPLLSIAEVKKSKIVITIKTFPLKTVFLETAKR